MKIKANLELRQISDNLFVLEAIGDTENTFSRMITFNSTAAFLWNSVKEKDFTVSDLATLLEQKFFIHSDIAKKDSMDIINAWLETNIIEYY